MIEGQDLLAYKDRFANERQLEKDYLQVALLNEIYLNISNELVFKGGTALEKIYSLDRFSEDLDFTYNGDLFDRHLIDAAISAFGEQYQMVVHHVPASNESFTLELRNIRGPLYNTRKEYQKLRVDISIREKVEMQPDVSYFDPIYRDIKRFSLCVMDIREIFAEKIRAILTRAKARDVYDLYFVLSKENISIDRKLIAKKLYMYETPFSDELLFKRLRSIDEESWKSELSHILLNVPKYQVVKKAIINYFEENAAKNVRRMRDDKANRISR